VLTTVWVGFGADGQGGKNVSDELDVGEVLLVGFVDDVLLLLLLLLLIKPTILMTIGQKISD
jgi:hypothetical protein